MSATDDISFENSMGLKSEDDIEGGFMKVMCIWLSFSILLMGCYTHTTVTKDATLPLPTVEVGFRLYDGTCIISTEYQRVENGYKVLGKLVNKENKNSRDFSGIVSDEQIKEVVTNVEPLIRPQRLSEHHSFASAIANRYSSL